MQFSCQLSGLDIIEVFLSTQAEMGHYLLAMSKTYTNQILKKTIIVSVLIGCDNVMDIGYNLSALSINQLH